MNPEMVKILDFAFDRYEKISAFRFGGGQLYIKIYTKQTAEEILLDFEEQCFNVIDIFDTVRDPKLISGDNEAGVEFVITFTMPKHPQIMLISDVPEN